MNKLFILILTIFSISSFSVPNSILIACDKVLYKDWNINLRNRSYTAEPNGREFNGKFLFKYPLDIVTISNVPAPYDDSGEGLIFDTIKAHAPGLIRYRYSVGVKIREYSFINLIDFDAKKLQEDLQEITAPWNWDEIEIKVDIKSDPESKIISVGKILPTPEPKGYFNFNKNIPLDLESIIWIEKNFFYHKSSDTRHIFKPWSKSSGVYTTDNGFGLSINRQLLTISTYLQEGIDTPSPYWRNRTKAYYTFCKLISSEQMQKELKIHYADKENIKKIIKQKEEDKKAEIKSKQKI